MMMCQVCKNEEAVMSGVDAFVLGIPTEKIGYNCANTYALVSRLLEEVKA